MFKKIIKTILWKPYNMKRFGSNSAIRFPYLIKGRKYISIGENTDVKKYAEIIAIDQNNGNDFTPSIEIGDNVYIGKFFHLYSMSKLVIGNGCVISDNVYISGASHGFDPSNGLIMKQSLSFNDVVIGENCFIGRNVFISPDITLGNNCVIGANSVVTKSFPPYSMIAGSPAKLIKTYSFEKNSWIKI